MLKAPLLNPILQRQINRLQNRQINKNTIYYDKQNVHSSFIQQSIKNSIANLMNAYMPI